MRRIEKGRGGKKVGQKKGKSDRWTGRTSRTEKVGPVGLVGQVGQEKETGKGNENGKRRQGNWALWRISEAVKLSDGADSL